VTSGTALAPLLPARPAWFPELPSGWRRARLDHIASVSARIGWKALTADEYVPDGFAFLSTPNIKAESIDFGEVNYISAFRYDESPELKLRIGDVLLAKDGNTLGIVNLVTALPRPATVNGSIAVIRPSGVLPAFLRYYLASQTAQSLIEALKGGMGVPHLFQFDLNRFPVPIPPVGIQRAIADYLDGETARIDTLVTAKQRMIELLEERWQGRLEVMIRGLAERYGDIPLKYMCREVVVGIVITPSAWYADSGIPALRGTNVSPGAISLDDLVYLTPEGHRLHPKSRLRSGDVVVVRTGQAGAAAVVPPKLDGANCIDLVIIRLGSRYAPDFLEFVLNSDWMQKHIAEYSVGTIQSHFNVGAASMVPVPQAPLVEQHAAVDELRREQRLVAGFVDALDRQLVLLQERRQALITAAVTGQLDIPEAR